MKNKIVILTDGRTTGRILDSILDNGSTYYLFLNFDNSRIYPIKPKDIFDIVDYKRDGGGEYIRSIENLHSDVETIIKFGL